MNGNFWKYQSIVVTLLFVLACQGSKESIAGSGVIEIDEYQVASLLGARVETIHVEEGQLVRRGQLIATLVADEASADVGATRAAQAAAQQNVAQAEANLANASEELSRAQTLFQSGVIAQQDLDRARLRRDVARTQRDAAAAQSRQSGATRSRAESRLRETHLYAPVDGRVLRRNFLPGEVVLPGAAVAVVGDLKSARLRIFVSERDLARIRPQQPALVAVDGLSKPRAAHVSIIGNEAEFTPRNVQTAEARARLVFAVTLAIENNDEALKPGMPADGQVLIAAAAPEAGDDSAH
ncbi:MAG: efflux RND transporter periplasmic adaptor subunit [Leptospirales bacterium]|nr:efflux RND transporter periplasmic adaptor subunit [Leptospirales bacterium]